MKFCPFLVAGRDLVQEHRDHEQMLDVAPESLGIPEEELDGSPVVDEAALDAARSEATDVAGMEAAGPFADSASLECLGETCRFYDAGDCRFDRLFRSGALVPEGARASEPVDAGDGEQPSLGYVLQEVWSLQRESLRELIEGFRKVEDIHSDRQGDLGTRLENIGARLEEVQNAGPHPEVVRILESRFENLDSCVGKLEGSMRHVLGESDSSLQSQLDETRQAVRAAVEESRRALQETFTDAVADVSKETRDVVRESLATSSDALRADIGQVRDETQRQVLDVQQTMHAVQDGVHQVSASVREVQGTLGAAQGDVQTAVERTLGWLRDALQDTRNALQEMVRDAGAESRGELERSLSRLLEDNGQMREVSKQVESALDALRNDMHGIASAAAQLESSSVETRQLLGDHQRHNEDLAARERREEARRLNNAGVMSYHQGAYDTSIDQFRKALEMDPTLAEAWNNLGLAQTELHQDAEALEAFRKALEIDPSVGQVYNNLGYLYHRRGELGDAVEMYERATQRSSDTSAAYSNLANALYQLDRVDDAVGAWKQALEIDPANDKASSALERLGLGSE
jgi:tetratricopeptide (TPR) repeat protein